LALHAAGETLDVPGSGTPAPSFRRVATTGALASAPDAYDPMDRAFQELGRRWKDDFAGWTVVRHYALQPDLLAVTYVWQHASGGPARVVTKGAPEAIAELCRLNAVDRDALRNETERMAEAGMRVLAVAEG